MSKPPTPIVPVPPPEKERPIPALSEQACQKCGATFRWERADLDRPRAPLSLRVVKGSDRCDCGYGRPRGDRRKG
ncbi:MAG: hypothetical protein WCZ23_04460 [Rhodospirillaceae bacterium]